MQEIEMEHAKQCPWCDRWALNGGACAFIFACGLDVDGVFNIGSGCGRSWCWECGKKYCGWYMDPQDGRKSKAAREDHGDCCASSPDYEEGTFCEGGHSSHCATRTFDPTSFFPKRSDVNKNIVTKEKKWEHINKMQAIVSKETGEIVGLRFQVE